MSAVENSITVADELSGEKREVSETEDESVQSSTDSDNLPIGKSLVNGTIDQDCVNHNLASKELDTDQDDEEVPKLSDWQLKKASKILKALLMSDTDALNASAISEGGLISDPVRQKVWPKLIGVDMYSTSLRPTQEEVESHPYYQQVLLDVNRSLKRFPPSIKEKQRLAMQDQLVLLIMRVLIKHPKFHYYQGYHDICVTFLLVLGEEMSFYVVERLSLTHLNIFMKKSMEPTVHMLNYMYPVFEKENPVLYKFLEKSDVGIIFALSWLITWFGHVLNNYSDVVRLFDFFMASSRWMPVYLSIAIVLHREKEILAVDCDMASVHGLLLDIPDDLPFEKLITHSIHLYKTYPPDSLTKAVAKLMEKRKQEMLALKQKKSPKKYGLVRYVWGVVQSAIPNKKMAFTIVITAAVLLSAIWFQSYRNKF